MEQREKLVELIREFLAKSDEGENMADYLLANGVVVLPCRCGDCDNHADIKTKRFPDLVRCEVFGMLVSKNGYCFRGEKAVTSDG